jgi:hypothetical protein
MAIVRALAEDMLRQYEADKNPNKTMNLLKAVQWSRASWEAVSEVTIQRCWWKSTIFKKPVMAYDALDISV